MKGGRVGGKLSQVTAVEWSWQCAAYRRTKMTKSTPLRAVAEVADDAVAGPALAPGQGRFGDGERLGHHVALGLEDHVMSIDIICDASARARVAWCCQRQSTN